jgi:hypothetical protein
MLCRAGYLLLYWYLPRYSGKPQSPAHWLNRVNKMANTSKKQTSKGATVITSNVGAAVTLPIGNNLAAQTNALIGSATANATMGNSLASSAVQKATALSNGNNANLITALSNGALEDLLQCNNKGSFWAAHSRQVGKGLPQWPNGFTLGKLANGPCGVQGKADFTLSQLAIAAAVNGTLSNAAAVAAGLAPHNIRAWLKRGWLKAL